MESVQETPPEPTAKRSRRGLFILLALLAVGLICAGGIYLDGQAVSGPVAKALAGESGADTRVYRRNWISRDEIVFDIRSVEGSISMADMTRRLLKAAEALKESSFSRVYLAYRGEERFYFEGAYFKRIGEERSYQNPIYTIRTMPENVRNLDSTPAFGTWTGGVIGVLGRQMEDSNEFHRRWWARDAIGTFIS